MGLTTISSVCHRFRALTFQDQNLTLRFLSTLTLLPGYIHTKSQTSYEVSNHMVKLSENLVDVDWETTTVWASGRNDTVVLTSPEQ